LEKNKSASEKVTLFFVLGQKINNMNSNSSSNNAIPVSFARQLHTYQRFWLQRVYQRSQTPYSQDPCPQKLHALVLAGLLQLGEEPISQEANYSRLGFANPKKPETEFNEPPALLALDGLHHIWEEDVYAKMVLEQVSRPEGYGYPFVKLAKAVMALLLTYFEAGKPPEEGSDAYSSLMFSISKKSPFFLKFFG